MFVPTDVTIPFCKSCKELMFPKTPRSDKESRSPKASQSIEKSIIFEPQKQNVAQLEAEAHMQLAVNIDHIATIRNARGGLEPDPVEAARICEMAGAVGIVSHLREDRRHIRDNDVRQLRKTVKTKLDLEMAATDEIIEIALDVRPELVTLVPEKRQELTTEGGLDVIAQKKRLTNVIKSFHSKKIAVSLFVAPEQSQIETSKEIGADMVELHTGEYANARTDREVRTELARIQTMAKLGKSLGLTVNGGHGLDYKNVSAIAAIPEIYEVSIGHAVITRAVYVGLETAVKEMVRLVSRK
jgi:pyridoxine 5-phosphate synthase